MHTNDYEVLAMRTQADQQKILERMVELGPNFVQLDMATRGLADEVGEVNAAVKKCLEYGKQLDAINVVEEVGDVMWRCAQIMDALRNIMTKGVQYDINHYTLENAMTVNIAKLAKRYPDQFSDQLANNRDLDAERKALEG